MVEMQVGEKHRIDVGGVDARADELVGRPMAAIEQVMTAVTRASSKFISFVATLI